MLHKKLTIQNCDDYSQVKLIEFRTSNFVLLINFTQKILLGLHQLHSNKLLQPLGIEIGIYFNIAATIRNALVTFIELMFLNN